MMLQYIFLAVFTIPLVTCEILEKEKIVGGKDAYINEYPYQVSLRVNGRHSCGGSIISSIHVLTAAHCIIGLVTAPYTNLKVTTGTSNSQYGGQTHSVLKVVTHPQYRGTGADSYKHDVAVITLLAPITFSAVQKPIRLPNSDVRGGESAVMTGWGMKAYPNMIQAIALQQSTTTIVASAQCQQYHRSVIHKEHVCAFSSYGKGICMGDSGGPLAVNGEIVGIASWVIPCAVGKPDVYTKVFAYKSFILQSMRG